MEQGSPNSRSVHFGTFDLDLQSGELRKSGLKIRLPHQSFRILARLLEQPGEVVSREELRQTLWSDDTFVDFEVGLSSAVKKLRDALGDSAENARFVETLPRRGYRFISPVRRHDTTVTDVRAPLDLSKTDDRRNDVGPGPVVELPARQRWLHPSLTMAALFVTIITGLAIVSLAAVRHRLVANATPASIRSIAVLPLVNLTGDPGQEYFVDGMTDNLITELAQISDVRVISRTSVMPYKEARKPTSVVRQELNVDAIVEGTVVRSGSRVRINAQLIDAHTELHMWAHPYERDANDIVALQSEVAKAIAEAIAGKVSRRSQARGVPSPHVSEEANALLLKAATAAGGGGYKGFQQAIGYADQAIAKQPDFARAYAAMAIWYNQFAFAGPLSPREFMPKAEEAARKALELDEATSQAHAALGLVLYRFRWDWEAAEKHFRRALEINPSYADGHRMLGVFLSVTGRTPAAWEEAQEARRLDPLSAQALFNIGTALLEAGQIERAISTFRAVLEKSPGLGDVHAKLGEAYLAKGELNAGLNELRTAITVRGSYYRNLAYLGYADAVVGNGTEARSILRDLDVLSLQQFVSPLDRAGIQLGLGQTDAAFALLDKAYEIHDPQVSRLLVDRRFAALGSDARFLALERRVGLR